MGPVDFVDLSKRLPMEAGVVQRAILRKVRDNFLAIVNDITMYA